MAPRYCVEHVLLGVEGSGVHRCGISSDPGRLRTSAFLHLARAGFRLLVFSPIGHTLLLTVCRRSHKILNKLVAMTITCLGPQRT